MKINVKENKYLYSDEVFTKTQPSNNSEAYKLCVKADALRFANMYKESISKYLQAIMLDRSNADCYYGIGISYKFLNNYEKSLEYLEKAKELDPNRFEISFETGVVFMLMGIPCQAIKHFIDAIMIDKENTDAQLHLAMAHELADEEDLALLIYNRVIECFPFCLNAYNHKAALLMCLGHFKEAASTFKQVIKLNKDYYKAYYGLGICFDRLNNSRSAQIYYRKFINMKPHSKDAEIARHRINMLKLQANSKQRAKLKVV